MAYQAGTASSMHDLLDKLRLFLVANGWTVNGWTSGDGWLGYYNFTGRDATGTSRLHVQKAAADGTQMYFNFRSATRLVIFEDNSSSSTITSWIDGTRNYNEVRGIGINGSTGYNAGSNWDQQPGCPEAGTTGKSIGACISEIPVGNSNYWFFQNGDCVAVVVEIASGTFMHMAFGCMVKSGSYSQGLFYSASLPSYSSSMYYWSTTLARRCGYLSRWRYNADYSYSGMLLDFEGLDWYHDTNEGSVAKSSRLYLGGFSTAATTNTNIYAYSVYHVTPSYRLVLDSPNIFNGVTPLIPIYSHIKDASSRFRYVGYPEGIRAVNCSNNNPGDEVVIGSDTWKIFPMHQKVIDYPTPTADMNNTWAGAYAGVAYKKA